MASDLGLADRERDLALQLFEAGLPPLSERRWLPFLFGVSPKLIGAMIVRGERYYRRFRMKKRSGGYREIVTPRRFLKTIQRWMLARIFDRIEVHESVHGFVKERNIFTNASPHLSRRNLLVVDIQDFFPSISYRDVKDLIQSQFEFPPGVIAQISGLCVLNGSLPQGAPTSPVLANGVFLSIDIELASLADRWGATYTRYADDIAISSDDPFDESHVEAVVKVIREGGFRVNDEKTRIRGLGERQMVAGVVVNSKGYPPRERRRMWRAMFHRASLHPHEFVDRLHQLEGIAAFVSQYDAEKAGEYRAVADEVRGLTPETG